MAAMVEGAVMAEEVGAITAWVQGTAALVEPAATAVPVAQVGVAVRGAWEVREVRGAPEVQAVRLDGQGSQGSLGDLGGGLAFSGAGH